MPDTRPDGYIWSGSRGVQNPLNVRAGRVNPFDEERGWSASVIDAPVGSAIHDRSRHGDVLGRRCHP